ncbi:MAG: polysaccharide deacetylase family protein [Solirubrobacterales bacterium]|nr:polysaccharide deacetylase family protein [Solirubrobacterales bacterium]
MEAQSADSQPAGRSGRPAAILRLTLAGALLGVICLVATPAATGVKHRPIERAKLSQSGRSLIVQVRTVKPVMLRKLDPRPEFRRDRARYLCLDLSRAGTRGLVRICFGGRRRPYHRVGVSRLAPNGKVISRKTIEADVMRRGRRGLTAAFRPDLAGLRPAGYRWQISYADGSCDGADGRSGCAATFPTARKLNYRLRPVRVVGCTGGNGGVVSHGPRRRKLVAFTFDDGPGPATPAVLRQLRRFRVKATFFMLGSQVNRYPGMARKVLAAGHELANHSSNHALLPGYSDISRASRAIRRRTGFRPCLFRPPYGAIGSGLKSAARRAGMKSVIWDVDTVDWSLPGSGTIRSRISHGVRRGSIVLMHDAGGPRGQTVAALPRAIRKLRRRGYRFVTVTELLGNRMLYRPVR